jgi:hypothetical protein
MTTRRPAPAPTPQHRCLRHALGVCLLALVLLQTLGLAHSVWHARGHSGAQAAGSFFDQQHEAGDVVCQLFDQVSHHDLVPTAALSCTAPNLALAPAVQASAPCLRRMARCFCARDPPRHSA